MRFSRSVYHIELHASRGPVNSLLLAGGRASTKAISKFEHNMQISDPKEPQVTRDGVGVCGSPTCARNGASYSTLQYMSVFVVSFVRIHYHVMRIISHFLKYQIDSKINSNRPIATSTQASIQLERLLSTSVIEVLARLQLDVWSLCLTSLPRNDQRIRPSADSVLS